MRLIGSFHTTVIHGRSGSARTSLSTCSAPSRCGVSVPGTVPPALRASAHRGLAPLLSRWRSLRCSLAQWLHVRLLPVTSTKQRTVRLPGVALVLTGAVLVIVAL